MPVCLSISLFAIQRKIERQPNKIKNKEKKRREPRGNGSNNYNYNSSSA